MKSSLLSSILTKFRYLFELWWSPNLKAEVVYPHCVEDLVEILGQVRENQTQVKVVGGSFPLAPCLKEDIIVSLSCMDKLIGLDVHQQTVTAEPGVKLSNLISILETVNMTLELSGPLPDLALVDAIAIGLTGTGGSLSANVLNVEVILPGGLNNTAHSRTASDDFNSDFEGMQQGQFMRRGPELAAWSWSTHPDRMAALFSGLGMVAVVTSVTLKCIPLYRVSETSSLLYLSDVMDTWALLGSRSPVSHHLTWFPFSELVIFKQISPIERSGCVIQSLLNRKVTELAQVLARFVRVMNLVFFSSSFLGWTLARIQFISLWSAARNRSDYSHPPISFQHSETVRGSTWLVPLSSIPPLLASIKQWCLSHPRHVTSPLEVYTVRADKRLMRAGSAGGHTVQQHPFLYPRLDKGGEEGDVMTASSCSSLDFSPRSARASPRNLLTQRSPTPSSSPLPPNPMRSTRPHAAAVCYDWFVTAVSTAEPSVDPTEVAQLEQLFLTAGGIRCWSGDRIVSPMVLSYTFPEYAAWCKVKYELDPDNVLTSGYVQGEIWSKPPKPKSSRPSRVSTSKAERSPMKENASFDLSDRNDFA